METLKVKIKQKDFNLYRFSSSSIDFEELVTTLKKKLVKDALRKTQSISTKYGLSKMTLSAINKEIKAARNAKNHS